MTSATATARTTSSAATAAAGKSATPAPKGILAALQQPKKIKEFSKKDLVDLFRGLGSMLRAQINTADALKYYSHGLPNKAMVEALMHIREDINDRGAAGASSTGRGRLPCITPMRPDYLSIEYLHPAG